MSGLELRTQVLIGELPQDFLRISVPVPINNVSQQTSNQRIVQQQLAQTEHLYHFVPPNTKGRIAIKIVEAKLTKNYGLPGVRMDPYIRLRVGGIVFETSTCVNGGKNPSWNRTINAYLPEGVESMYIQIFDERAFTQDEMIAWAHIILPQTIFTGEVIDEWYKLSGPQGECKEGLVNLVFSFSPIQTQLSSQASQSNTPLLYTEDELNELHEMFPNVDKDVVRSILENNQGSKDATVTVLIEMNQ